MTKVDRAMFFTAENNKQTVTEEKTDLSTQLPWTFELLDDHVPSQFLRGDVHKNGTRHLIFATDAQLEFLTNVKTWYVDATFKVIKQPFTQLFSIHVFVKKDGKLMQTPLAFIVMSPRRRKDCKRVFRALIAALPRRPRIQAVVSDFEAAVCISILLCRGLLLSQFLMFVTFEVPLKFLFLFLLL